MNRKIFDLKELEVYDNLDEEFDELTEEQIKENLPNLPPAKLADIVITNRYIGLYKTLAIDAMTELAKRRMEGDTFQYEKYIDDNLKDLPKLDFSLPDFMSIVDYFKGKK